MNVVQKNIASFDDDTDDDDDDDDDDYDYDYDYDDNDISNRTVSVLWDVIIHHDITSTVVWSNHRWS